MTGRLLPAIHFMFDAFIVSLVLVFVSTNAALPVLWNWLLASVAISCIAYFLFSKSIYRLSWMIGICLVAAGGMWGAGVPLWLAAILGMLAIYLMHARYSTNADEFNDDHHFLMKFVLVFSICWVLLLVNPDQQTSRLLFTLVPAAVLFYVAAQLLSRYFQSAADGARFSQAAGAFGIVAGASAIAAISTLFFADEVRKFVGVVLGGAIQLLFWPLALLLEQVSEFLSGLSTEEEVQETIDKIGPDEESVREDAAVGEAISADFPVEILLGFVVLACAIALVIWMRKIRPDSRIPDQEAKASIKRYSHTSAEQPVETPDPTYGQSLELHQVREVFRGLEQMAKDHGKERQKYETVREWVARMQWEVPESFYKTYDQVRYGDKRLPDTQATQFIDEIEKIKGKYLKENV
ncbi:hypothetical protein ACRC6Q_06100 [Planococcus sp. SE5232]|uniref:hypothetical protein n=1 Tax=unclassified Planococcus (in: firmicutes) TaxID=2662419 RepID=UPI003D6B48C6